ncbi:MAG: aminoglycoside 6-adenylyltransferase [Armatimonas sp.]
MESDTQVLALAVFGSARQETIPADPISDLDCLVVVEEATLSRYGDGLEWLAPPGEVYASERFVGPFFTTWRICFADLQRLDLILTTPEQLERLPEWPSVPFWQGIRLAFCRDPQIELLLEAPWPAPALRSPTNTEFEALVQSFWFKAVQASVKTLRDDRLTALHLTLDLLRDVCVLGMILRDREAGTNIHKQGGSGNVLVDSLELPPAEFTQEGVLAWITRCTILFDALAGQWSAGYEPRHEPLLAWIERLAP